VIEYESRAGAAILTPELKTVHQKGLDQKLLLTNTQVLTRYHDTDQVMGGPR
jgi:hypothetical protein